MPDSAISSRRQKSIGTNSVRNLLAIWVARSFAMSVLSTHHLLPSSSHPTVAPGRGASSLHPADPVVPWMSLSISPPDSSPSISKLRNTAAGEIATKPLSPRSSESWLSIFTPPSGLPFAPLSRSAISAKVKRVLMATVRIPRSPDDDNSCSVVPNFQEGVR